VTASERVMKKFLLGTVALFALAAAGSATAADIVHKLRITCQLGVGPGSMWAPTRAHAGQAVFDDRLTAHVKVRTHTANIVLACTSSEEVLPKS
jgi:hypothetical protein